MANFLFRKRGNQVLFDLVQSPLQRPLCHPGDFGDFVEAMAVKQAVDGDLSQRAWQCPEKFTNSHDPVGMRLAVYGLGSVQDHRICRYWRAGPLFPEVVDAEVGGQPREVTDLENLPVPLFQRHDHLVEDFLRNVVGEFLIVEEVERPFVYVKIVLSVQLTEPFFRVLVHKKAGFPFSEFRKGTFSKIL